MTTIYAFFDDLADAFSRGDLDTSAGQRTYPTMIYMKEGLLPVPTKAAAKTQLAQLRGNLANFDYARSKASVEETLEVYPNKHWARVRWSHHSSSDDVIATTDVSYFCKKRCDGWTIDMADIRTPLDPELAVGLPIILEAVESA